MPNLTVSNVIDTFMQSATQADARTALGISSIVGSSGSAGSSGNSGTNGSSGSSGTTGTSGSSGSSGTSGNSGTHGTSGENGSSGTSGTSGVSGISGGAILYFNTSVPQSPYKEISITPTGNIEITSSIFIASGSTSILESYQTPVGYPNVTSIPAGIWSMFLHTSKLNASSSFEISTDVYLDQVVQRFICFLQIQ